MKEEHTPSEVIGTTKPPTADLSKTEKRTLKDVLDSVNTPTPALAETVIETFITAAAKINPLVQEIYAFTDSKRVQFFTVVSGNGDRNPLYELERQGHVAYPTFDLSFRVVSSGELTPEQIEAMRKNWMASGRLMYP